MSCTLQRCLYNTSGLLNGTTGLGGATIVWLSSDVPGTITVLRITHSKRHRTCGLQCRDLPLARVAADHPACATSAWRDHARERSIDRLVIFIMAEPIEDIMCVSAESLSSTEFEDLIRQKLPTALRDHSAFRFEIMDIIADVFATRDNFERLLEEIKELKEDGNRRFEEICQRFEKADQRFDEMNHIMNQRFEKVDQRFEKMDQRFEKVDQRFEKMDQRFERVDQRFDEMARNQREIQLTVSALGGRVGHGLEEIIKQTVEEFSGQTFEKIEHLWLRDAEGELYGVPADVEYDLYLEDTVNYVVEVKSHTKLGDVLNFRRKSAFAEKCLEKKIQPIIISVSVTETAKKKCKELGIDLIARSVVEK